MAVKFLYRRASMICRRRLVATGHTSLRDAFLLSDCVAGQYTLVEMKALAAHAYFAKFSKLKGLVIFKVDV